MVHLKLLTPGSQSLPKKLPAAFYYMGTQEQQKLKYPAENALIDLENVEEVEKNHVTTE